MPQNASQKNLLLAFILLLCAATASALYFVELRNPLYVPPLAYLYLVPVSAGAYLYGVRTGLLVSFFCCLLYAPFAASQFSVSGVEGFEELLDFLLFSVTGAAAGFLSERLHREREHAYVHSRLEELAAAASHDVGKLTASYHELASQSGLLKHGAALPFARELARSLEESFNVHLKKAELVREILSANRRLETVLSGVPFGAARLSRTQEILFQNVFFDEDEVLLERAVEKLFPREEGEPVYEAAFDHDGHVFLARKILLPSRNETVLLVQDMDDKRNYEKTQENYRIKTAFLKHISGAFSEKTQRLERVIRQAELSAEARVKKSRVEASWRVCEELLEHIDGVLTKARDDADRQ